MRAGAIARGAIGQVLTRLAQPAQKLLQGADGQARAADHDDGLGDHQAHRGEGAQIIE